MSISLTRRSLFRNLACACGCAALPPGLVASPASAASDHPKSDLTPDQALARLKEGNEAFVKGGACALPAGGPARIAELAKGQAPFGVVLTCSDSRTPPEHIFSRGLGELFIIRVAGNTVDTAALGSIEYGVGVLGAPLVLVLGHSSCGAVDAAVKVVKARAKLPGHIGQLIQPIIPSARKAARDADPVAAAVRFNVERTVAQLKGARPIVSKAVAGHTAKVVGGVYDLATGTVAFV